MALRSLIETLAVLLLSATALVGGMVTGVPAAWTQPAVAPELLAGKLLVAAEKLHDPDFARTVVYICRHDASGTFGLVLNRPAGELSLGEILRSFRIEPGSETGGVMSLRYGGPVQRDAGFILHTSEFQAGTSLCRRDGIAVSSGHAVLDAFAAGKRPQRSVLFLGYSGWDAGQLEAELKRKDWIIVDADAATFFGTGTETMWRRALERRGIDL